jgi:hypothetical protein
MGNNKKTKTPTTNDKMATSDNKVLKMHVRNIRGAKLDMIFYFQAIGGTKTLRVESVGCNVKGHQGIKEYIGDIVGTMFKNVLHVTIFQTKDHWEVW